MTQDELFLARYMFSEELSVSENWHDFDPNIFKRPEEYMDISSYSLSILEKVKSSFKTAGWDGKGDLGLLYVQPFIAKKDKLENSIEYVGTFIWHVRNEKEKRSLFGIYPKSMKSVKERSDVIRSE